MRRTLPLAPVILAAALWTAGSGLVVGYVLLSDEWLMGELLRQGLVTPLLATLVSFLAPFLPAALAANSPTR